MPRSQAQAAGCIERAWLFFDSPANLLPSDLPFSYISPGEV
jgi:hypothetical protein